MNAYPFSFLVGHQREVREFAAREEAHRRMDRSSTNHSKNRILSLLLAAMMVAATPWR